MEANADQRRTQRIEPLQIIKSRVHTMSSWFVSVIFSLSVFTQFKSATTVCTEKSLIKLREQMRTSPRADHCNQRTKKLSHRYGHMSRQFGGSGQLKILGRTKPECNSFLKGTVIFKEQQTGKGATSPKGGRKKSEIKVLYWVMLLHWWVYNPPRQC